VLLLFTVFPIVLAAFAMAVRVARRNRSARHWAHLAAAFGFLSLAVPVHAYGHMTTLYFMVDEQCGARGAGEFIDFHERFFPVSGVLECTDRTIQLVPAWVDPVVLSLCAAALLSALAAAAAWNRGRRAPAAR
jgi:hypothetical protein